MRRKNYLKLAAYQTEQSKRHLDEVRSIHEEMRGYKHDFHHHLQTLKGQLEAGEIQRALAYVQQLDHELMHVDTLLKTGNVSLDAILSAKIAQAKKEQIAVTLQAAVPDQLTITDLELSIVVGNLLDNAIEACRSVQGERFIRIVHQRENAVFFYVEFRGGKAKQSGKAVPLCKKRRPWFWVAACRSNSGGAWRMVQIQQRKRRFHLGISCARASVNTIHALTIAVGACFFFEAGRLCYHVCEGSRESRTDKTGSLPRLMIVRKQTK